jgi:hypothetical protein
VPLLLAALVFGGCAGVAEVTGTATQQDLLQLRSDLVGLQRARAQADNAVTQLDRRLREQATEGERQTAAEFEKPEYRFLVVANKFQTGFDQPLLHTMYVDKKLGGVNAVQTLSRLNRTHDDPKKRGTMVLDFANEADEIRVGFEPYYETTLLSEATDPNLLYETQSRLMAFPVYTEADVDGFAKVYFDRKATQDQLYAVLAPVVDRFRELSEEEQHDFRGQLTDYVRLYAFLAQVLTFADADLEKLYVFARHLRRLLRGPDRAAPRGAAEHRHGVVPHPADGERQDRARAQDRPARSDGHEGPARSGPRAD